MFWDVLWDAGKDAISVLPVLFVVYICISFAEDKMATNTKFTKYTQSKYAVFMGSAVGLIPQCGFSVAASSLYAKRYITMGTLLAVFIATSDEALPILLSTPGSAGKVLPVLLIKFIYAIIIGYGISLFFYLKKKKETVAVCPCKEHEQEVHAVLENHHACCGHSVKEKNSFNTYFVHPALHSFKVILYIFIINLLLGTVIFFIGEEQISSFLASVLFLQPILVPLVGIIPNCAGSIIITQLYLQGGISFGACVGGLTVSAGLGLAVLFKQNKNVKQNFAILAVLFFSGIVLGYSLTLLNISF